MEHENRTCTAFSIEFQRLRQLDRVDREVEAWRELLRSEFEVRQVRRADTRPEAPHASSARACAATP